MINKEYAFSAGGLVTTVKRRSCVDGGGRLKVRWVRRGIAPSPAGWPPTPPGPPSPGGDSGLPAIRGRMSRVGMWSAVWRGLWPDRFRRLRIQRQYEGLSMRAPWHGGPTVRQSSSPHSFRLRGPFVIKGCDFHAPPFYQIPTDQISRWTGDPSPERNHWPDIPAMAHTSEDLRIACGSPERWSSLPRRTCRTDFGSADYNPQSKAEQAPVLASGSPPPPPHQPKMSSFRTTKKFKIADHPVFSVFYHLIKASWSEQRGTLGALALAVIRERWFMELLRWKIRQREYPPKLVGYKPCDSRPS